MNAALIKQLHQRLIPPETEEGWLPYLWLVYLGFFFIEWFFRPLGSVELLLSLLSLAIFIALYFSAFRRHGRAAFFHVICIAGLGVVWSSTNSGASVFFIYAASFAFRVGPPRVSLLIISGISCAALLTALVLQPMFLYWIPGVFVSIIIGIANVFMGEQQRRNAELRLSQAEVRRLARVAERERIARDLHDVLGHTLSVIAVKSELAARLVESKPEQAGDEMRSVQETARTALAEVREAIGGIRTQDLDEAIDQVRSGLRAANVELEFERDPDLVLSPQRESMLALVIREATTNVIRHARASVCRIALVQQANGEVVLDISDDGQGRIKPEGGGIQGMFARIEALGGRLDIKSDHGRRLRAELPLEASGKLA